MRLDRFITLNVVRPWRSLFARNSAPDSEGAVPVLMYHSISNDPETGISGYYRVNTTPAAFRDQMAFLSENGYRTLTVSQLVTALQSGKKPEVGGLRTEDRSQPSAFLVITFDDGFHNFYTDAFPVLNEFGFSATMFLPTAFIGETRRPFVPQSGTSASPKQCLTWSEVQECHQAGIEFGSHTVNHPTLVGVVVAGDQIRGPGLQERNRRPPGPTLAQFLLSLRFSPARPPVCRTFHRPAPGVRLLFLRHHPNRPRATAALRSKTFAFRLRTFSLQPSAFSLSPEALAREFIG